MLRAFAAGGGRLDWRSPDAGPKNQKRREVLGQALQRYFRIDGDPILLDPDGKSWRIKFQIADDR
ncbi:hypothetical protein [Limnoglobus roseus]|uniref:hypothetical protein n=1 Tax=Limnoglobus roseus TaxID=2598579 RepID=UPI0011EACFA4|nr:hypothetical protein [Limnoglobus roseus]